MSAAPIGIALLNSYAGLAGSATGFALHNNILIIAGALDGASGLILAVLMSKAMNRPLSNVIFGKIEASTSASADDVYGGKVRSTNAEELALLLADAQRVVVVPGYGMAVSQAQHAVRDLFRLLEARGATVEFAIHPVAGRMPGHMNVLLAEADIPYERLLEMDQINPTFETVDVAIVVGANDVVNPDARNTGSPIAGMPILDVDKARMVINIKRSLSPGFAGIPNPLFALDNSLMFFADAQAGILEVVKELKAL
jgi:H+-translocating NAD(P) transhydrogenase subunit beta